ncbi:MAG: hypothetical protein RLZZ299_2301 [Pseudomonadota bacterium]|jgi:phenylalanyl-tRNA synthetase beta chain
MRVPVSLLRRLVDLPDDLDTLVRELNARVSEVEHVHRHPPRDSFGDVRIVTLVEAVAANGGYTRWRLHDGHHVVVGDRFGVRPGERCAAVMAGGHLPDGTPIDTRDVAGLASDGALVSEAMLGIGRDSANPLRFAPDTALDAHPWDALELDDVVLEFDLEPNRPDLFSLVGVARDVGAIWNHAVRMPETRPLEDLPALQSPALALDTPRARAYLAMALDDVTVGPSPQWLQNAVRKLGMRPINAVVDAANLAMMELGEPVHTFDRDALTGDTVQLRMAADGETVTTLDGVTRTLTAECMLVCDASPARGESTPIAIAGVMGDARTEVRETTRRVLLEVAAFDMAAVRRASRRLSLRTEASLRFEKGLPVASIEPAAARLAFLLETVCGARPVALTRVGAPPPARTRIPLDLAALRGRLGMDVSDDTIVRLLQASGCVVGDGVCEAPEHRPDLRIAEDLVEEVGRLHGYVHVMSEAPRMALAAPRPNPWMENARRARRLLTAHGFDEVYLPVWIGDEEVGTYGFAEAGLVRLINPLAENLRWFRPSPLPHLVDAAMQNRKELASFSFFEVGRTYARGEDGRLIERQVLGALALGAHDVLAVRDLAVAFGRASGADVAVSRAEHPHLHPGRTLRVGEWATIGELHPRLVRLAGLREAPVVMLADLEALAGLAPQPVRFTPPPRFPGITVDVNVTVPPHTEADRVRATVPSNGLLRDVSIQDVWPLADGARITLRLAFQAHDRSLAQDEIVPLVAQARGVLEAAGWNVAG